MINSLEDREAFNKALQEKLSTDDEDLDTSLRRTSVIDREKHG